MNQTIKRDSYLQKLIERKENGLVKVITGIRRCGKSFLLFNLFYDHLIACGVKPERIITIALDDDQSIQYRDPAILYNELLCRGYSVDVGVVEVIEGNDGKQTRKQCEIDFVINRGAKKYYIQSALSVSDPAKMEAELRPLKKTRDFFKKIIINKSSMKPWTDDDGILHLGLYEFLLNENALES